MALNSSDPGKPHLPLHLPVFCPFQRGAVLLSSFLTAGAAIVGGRGPNWRFILLSKIPGKPRRRQWTSHTEQPHPDAALSLCPPSPSPWTEFKRKCVKPRPTVKFSIFKAKLPAIDETAPCQQASGSGRFSLSGPWPTEVTPG